MTDDERIYDAVGGDGPFFELVDEFYRRVEAKPALRGLYPPDLAPGKDHLAWFLIQRFGGPGHFSNCRGAPRLRMRHAHFAITRAQRDAWVECMAGAVGAVDAFAPYCAAMMDYFEHSATFLINREPPSGLRMSTVLDDSKT